MAEVLIWGDMRRVPRRRCPIAPHTLVQGESAFDVRFYTEALAVTGLLILFKLLLFSTGQQGEPLLAFFGSVVVPLGLTWLSARLAEPTSFLITTQGIETERGRMDFGELESISVTLGHVTLHGSSGGKLVLSHMRQPHLLREVIWAARDSRKV